MPEKLRSMEACGSDLDLTYENTDTLPLGYVPVVSRGRVLEADLLSPVGYKVGPPWIKIAPACPIDLGSEKKLGGLLHPLNSLSLVMSQWSRLFFWFFCPTAVGPLLTGRAVAIRGCI